MLRKSVGISGHTYKDLNSHVASPELSALRSRLVAIGSRAAASVHHRQALGAYLTNFSSLVDALGNVLGADCATKLRQSFSRHDELLYKQKAYYSMSITLKLKYV